MANKVAEPYRIYLECLGKLSLASKWILCILFNGMLNHFMNDLLNSCQTRLPVNMPQVTHSIAGVLQNFYHGLRSTAVATEEEFISKTRQNDKQPDFERCLQAISKLACLYLIHRNQVAELVEATVTSAAFDLLRPVAQSPGYS